MAEHAVAALAIMAISTSLNSETPTQTPASAVDRVFGIAELAESILSLLPMKPLLRARRVSKQWKALLDGLALQQTLFLKPEKVSTVFTATSYLDVDGAASYYSGKTIMREIFTVTGRIPGAQADRSKVNFKLVRLNGVLFGPSRARLGEPRDDLDVRATAGEAFDIQIPILRHWYETRKDRAYPWYMQMFLTQPPTTKVKLVILPAGRQYVRQDEKFSRVVANKDGVRFYDVLKAYLDILSNTCADAEGFFYDLGLYDATVYFGTMPMEESVPDRVIIPYKRVDDMTLQARAEALEKKKKKMLDG